MSRKKIRQPDPPHRYLDYDPDPLGKPNTWMGKMVTVDPKTQHKCFRYYKGHLCFVVSLAVSREHFRAKPQHHYIFVWDRSVKPFKIQGRSSHLGFVRKSELSKTPQKEKWLPPKAKRVRVRPKERVRPKATKKRVRPAKRVRPK